MYRALRNRYWKKLLSYYVVIIGIYFYLGLYSEIFTVGSGYVEILIVVIIVSILGPYVYFDRLYKEYIYSQGISQYFEDQGVNLQVIDKYLHSTSDKLSVPSIQEEASFLNTLDGVVFNGVLYGYANGKFGIWMKELITHGKAFGFKQDLDNCIVRKIAVGKQLTVPEERVLLFHDGNREPSIYAIQDNVSQRGGSYLIGMVAISLLIVFLLLKILISLSPENVGLFFGLICLVVYISLNVYFRKKRSKQLLKWNQLSKNAASLYTSSELFRELANKLGKGTCFTVKNSVFYIYQPISYSMRNIGLLFGVRRSVSLNSIIRSYTTIKQATEELQAS